MERASETGPYDQASEARQNFFPKFFFIFIFPKRRNLLFYFFFFFRFFEKKKKKKKNLPGRNCATAPNVNEAERKGNKSVSWREEVKGPMMPMQKGKKTVTLTSK